MNTSEELEFYRSITQVRYKDAVILSKILSDNFNFDYVECIETGASQNLNDGCFGLYLAKITEVKNGIYHSVDISENIVSKSKKLFESYITSLTIHHHVSDSLIFLTKYEGSPNLVHLDSYDLDLKNPIPSMLHGFLEFQAIKDKMPTGSIILIDDNFLKGTWVSWNMMVYGETSSEIIDINYDIIGKGSLIYHWCQKQDTDWDIIGNHYIVGENIKIIIKKR